MNLDKRIAELKSELDGIAAQALEEGRYDIEAKANRAFYDFFERPENKSALPMKCCESCDAGYHEHSLAPGAKCDCKCHGNDLLVVQPPRSMAHSEADGFSLQLVRFGSFLQSGNYAEAR